MKYIIMCGGDYQNWEMPRHLTEVCGEPVVARTIRLLREQGVEDIAISSNDPIFEKFGVPVLKHDNDFVERACFDFDGYWCNCFYPMDEPACYLFGDVIFSPEAIRTIVEYETDDIMLFGSKPPFAEEYPKPWREPFAYKVTDQQHLHKACERFKELDALGKFRRRPISWELWSVIRGTKVNKINKNYVAINDYTCDIDSPEDVSEEWINTISSTS